MIIFNKTQSRFEHLERQEQYLPMDSVVLTFCPESINLLPHSCD